MLMDSVTVLLHRLGVAYTAIMNPVFRVRRGPDGELLDIEPASDAASRDGIDETWIHVQLGGSADNKAIADTTRLLPSVLADARQVALDSNSMAATLRGLAAELDSEPGRFPHPERKDVAALLRWLADGHFVLLGYQRCAVHDGRSSVDPASRLGVLRLRQDVLPQLTQGRSAGAGAGHHPELPALRRLSLHRGGPGTGRAIPRSNTGSSGCSPSPR